MTTPEKLPWASMLAMMKWKPGEHVTLVGPTGRGKTEASIELIKTRKWVTFLATKRKDDTQDALRSLGFREVSQAKQINPEVHGRYIFKPPFTRGARAKDLKAAHGESYANALITLRDQTGWTILADEARYLSKTLGLSDELETLWLQGRSEGTTLIVNTQRPRFIPLEAYDQATHLFLWSDPDRNNVARVGDAASLSPEICNEIIPHMGKHEILYVNAVTKQCCITNTRW